MTLELSAIQEALLRMGLDGWLLYDFRGTNPVARLMLGLEGMATRRLFVLIPARGQPVAVAHRIELQPLQGFPGRVRVYSAWPELEAALREVVGGKRVAMEVFPEDGVPYLDRVPWGVVRYLERLGATVVPSDELVARFAARWTTAQLADHRATAEILARIARDAFAGIATALAEGRPLREAAIQATVLAAITRAGLETEDRPVVAFGVNSANPHYGPREGADAVLAAGQVVLLDLWARRPGSVFADQTWMAHAGPPSDHVAEVWTVVRGARDAVVARLRDAWSRGEAITGAALDDVARGVVRAAGYADAFVHRTGHAIDRVLHGSGPNLDNFETRDDRPLLAGLGFSVEPGVYLEGRFGVRSEINVALHSDGPEVTPAEPQRDLAIL